MTGKCSATSTGWQSSQRSDKPTPNPRKIEPHMKP
jgi:hypothetical protein